METRSDRPRVVSGRLRPRQHYVRPKLIRFGDIRDLTLGSSPGVGESGNPTMFRP